GVGEDNMVREIGIVPKPLQKPYPPVYQPFAFSESTIRWCARQGIQPILSPVDISHQTHLYHAYQDEAAKHGRQLAFGEGMGLLRDVLIADTMEEALALYVNGAPFVNQNWFAPFGFGQGIEAPGEKREDLTLEKMLERGHLLVGTVDSVTRQLEALMKRAPVYHIMAYQYIGLTPHEAQMKSIELFGSKVLPRFKDVVSMS
ncbi:MAG TPA: LLM class flavin-dependent oxidoreductase, partial [Dehalococcoidia bacterium]|nr:LLM class flavin-dependent oxidoreductase [Dehalococcoidia bacterium]